jgi:hypothetical protein
VAGVRAQFPDIQLTDQEEAVALLDAYRKKAERLKAEAKEQRRRDKIADMTRMWTADECYDYAFERGRAIGIQKGFEFTLDDDNADVFEWLSWYFSNDPRFETLEYNGQKYSLNKGLCLLSPVRGNGKTTLLDCFMYNRKASFIRHSTKQMAKDYEKKGLEAVERYMWLLPIAAQGLFFYQSHVGIHYDDFGDEPEVMHMGNRRHISTMIINSIYDDHADQRMFFPFHVSMNYTWTEFEQKFGTNPADRMEEMFNLIPVPGKSRRK